MIKFLALGAHGKLDTIVNKLRLSQVDFTNCKTEDLEISITSERIDITVRGENILDFDYVWLTASWFTRPILYAVSLFLEENNIEYTQIEEERSKFVDMLQFGLDGISHPDTYFCTTKNLEKKLDSIVATCSYPFIIKPTRGSLGSGIFLVHSKKEFVETLPLLKKHQAYICQRFIPNLFDYRIIIADSEVVSICKRIRQDDTFRNNTHLGAKEIFIEPELISSDVLNLAIDAATTLNLDWAGVDVVTSTETGKSYVIEINRRPDMTLGTSEISAAFDHILSLSQL